MNPFIEKKANAHALLRSFYDEAKGQTDVWCDLALIARPLSIGGDKVREAYNHLIGENLLQPYGSGLTVMLTDKAGQYIHNLDSKSERDVVLGALDLLRTSPNSYLPLSKVMDAVGAINNDEIRSEIIKSLYRHELIERANTGEDRAKISEKGRKTTSTTLVLSQPTNSRKATTMKKAKSKPLKVFISHATADSAVTSKFCNLILGNVFNIPHKDIFNTSHVGTKPLTGEDFRTRIKRELEEATVIFQFISTAYRNSHVCLIEMGAAWVLSKNVIPLIVEKGEYDVGFIHSTNQQAQLHSKAHLLKAMSDLVEQRLLKPSRADILSEKVDEFVDWMNSNSAGNGATENKGKKPIAQKASTDDTDIRIIRNYLESKKFTFISFDRLQELDARYNETFISKLIRKFPDDLTKSTAKGKKGIKILYPDFEF